MIQGQPRQKVSEFPSQQLGWQRWLMTDIPATCEDCSLRPVLGKSESPMKRKRNLKRMAQVVGQQSSNWKATKKYVSDMFEFQNFFYCCAGWGYIVAFTKVLTMYQIYHS
jgi:hypothetical protein